MPVRAQVPVPAGGPTARAGLPVAAARPPAEARVAPALHRSAMAEGRPARWLAAAMAALAVLAAAAAVVSFAAQYRMVAAAKHSTAVAALEAGIPDVAALIFATLGIALALHGRRALRARMLNLAAVGTSLAMNLLAAGHGWRDLAIWVMPPAAYALTSDTAIGVVRARAIALHKQTGDTLADDAVTPLAIVGGLMLWLLRLALAPASTLAGFRAWVIEECPVAPGRHASTGRPPRAPAGPAGRRTGTAPTRRPAGRGPSPQTRAGSKTARFISLVASRYGPLHSFPLADVSPVSSELAPQAGLDAGAARAALRRHVQAARAAQHQQVPQAAGPGPAARAPSPVPPAQNGSPR